jgi:hypothetical protein
MTNVKVTHIGGAIERELENAPDDIRRTFRLLPIGAEVDFAA